MNGKLNLVSRLSITFDRYEKPEQSARRRYIAEQKQREIFKMLNMERIFFSEITKLQVGIHLPKPQSKRILKLVGGRQNPETIADLLL